MTICSRTLSATGMGFASARQPLLLPRDIGEFKSLDQDDDFDLNSGHFTALNANDLTVKVFGFDDGERVAKQVLTLDPDREFVKFGSQFDDIDEVRFVAKGGTDANPNDNRALTQFFLMDDLFIDF